VTADPLHQDSGYPYEDVYLHRDPVGPGYSSRRNHMKVEPFEDDDAPPRYKTRKRPRASGFRRRADDDEPPATVSAKRGIKIGDSEEVWKFYQQRFRGVQQTACKLIAKHWIKAIEPKKQSRYPYTGGEAPPWWPKPWGSARDEVVTHKEPDHQKKNGLSPQAAQTKTSHTDSNMKTERVHLLCYILRLVVDNQDRQVQDQKLSVTRLEEEAVDALHSFFNQENTKNLKKRPLIKEILKVAKEEERYKRGEIGRLQARPKG
jgi:Protein of unknown function (DUF2841)